MDLLARKQVKKMQEGKIGFYRMLEEKGKCWCIGALDVGGGGGGAGGVEGGGGFWWWWWRWDRGRSTLW